MYVEIETNVKTLKLVIKDTQGCVKHYKEKVIADMEKLADTTTTTDIETMMKDRDTMKDNIKKTQITMKYLKTESSIWRRLRQP